MSIIVMYVICGRLDDYNRKSVYGYKCIVCICKYSIIQICDYCILNITKLQYYISMSILYVIVFFVSLLCLLSS